MRRGKRNEVSQAEVRRCSRSVDAGQAVVAGRFWTAGNNRLRYGGVQMGRRMRRSSRNPRNRQWFVGDANVRSQGRGDLRMLQRQLLGGI